MLDGDLYIIDSEMLLIYFFEVFIFFRNKIEATLDASSTFDGVAYGAVALAPGGFSSWSHELFDHLLNGFFQLVRSRPSILGICLAGRRFGLCRIVEVACTFH